MSQRPKRTKPDANQAQIVEDLRSLGFDVDIVCDLSGLYDIVVSGKKVAWILDGTKILATCSVRVEVKSEKGKITPVEKTFYTKINHKGSYIVARSTEDVLEWFGA